MQNLARVLVTSLLAVSASFLIAADFPEGSPKFETSLSSALTKGKAEGKPVIAVFSAVWCGPCQAMKKNVYPSKEVKGLHDKFIWAYVDIDVPANEADANKYKVSSIPHIQFINADGSDLGVQNGGSTPEQFAKKLEGVLKTAKK